MNITAANSSEVIGLNRRLENPQHAYNRTQKERLFEIRNQEGRKHGSPPLIPYMDRIVFFACLVNGLNDTMEFLFQKISNDTKSLMLKRVMQIRTVLSLHIGKDTTTLILDYDRPVIQGPELECFLNRRINRHTDYSKIYPTGFLELAISNYRQKRTIEAFQIIQLLKEAGADDEVHSLTKRSLIKEVSTNIHNYSNPFDENGSKFLSVLKRPPPITLIKRKRYENFENFCIIFTICFLFLWIFKMKSTTSSNKWAPN